MAQLKSAINIIHDFELVKIAKRRRWNPLRHVSDVTWRRILDVSFRFRQKEFFWRTSPY